ncbi:hypothetical protein LOK49_LG08G00522 [Camellia lanceoleosa]|uniref:Uncharacterized protein n=1 Tax=Camellia lanceoleosa TaxID=1840588 RepID=A0ACC0GPP5_9ERIC|nr:hypothetical protein LOK49_LG08G00522 [Camellia lanceoleosa]
MGGQLRYQIGQNAYIKLILHALKHRSSAVNGLLLGRLFGGDSNPVVEIADSIEEYYGAQGLSIAGYFHANERFDDSELENVAKNIGDHIHRYFSQAGLLLLYTRDSSKSWKLIGDGSSRLTMKERTNIILLDYISNRKWQDIVDFNDHLDDISK